MTEEPDDTDDTEEQAEEQGEVEPAPIETASEDQIRVRLQNGETPDYAHIDPDHTKGYQDMNAIERRAILLNRMEQAGHPRAIPQSYRELGDEFGVGKSTIGDDMDRLREYVAENLNRDHHSIMDSVFRGAVLDLVKEGKRAWAAEVGREWYEWLADLGEVERVPDEMNLDATVRSDANESPDYEVIPDDEAEAMSIPAEGGPVEAEDGGGS